MKVTNTQIEEMITAIAGPAGIQIYKQLKGKENVNEFIIAEKLKMPINQLRNIMYKFENYNLLSSTRKKDRKKGWYIYFWTFNADKAQDVVMKIRRDRLNFLKRKIDEEQDQDFFSCPKKCNRMPYDEAMESGFKCNECGSLLEQEDNSLMLNKIKKEIQVLEKELN